MKSKFIGIDFDGTIVKYDWPNVGEPNDGAIETIHELIDHGHNIILYTMRTDERLVEAVEYLDSHAVKLFGVNHNPTQHHWNNSPKIFCNLYIDDAALGTPMITPEKGKPYVDWEHVRELLCEQGYLSA